MINQGLEYKFFLLLLILVTLGFCWILLPFHGAVFWAVSLAILFRPLQCCGFRSIVTGRFGRS